MKNIEYTLTMNSDQAHEVLKAVELLMRLKLNQSEEISRAVMVDDYWENGTTNGEKFDEFIHRRDRADAYMKRAFLEIFPPWENVKKDDEWYRLYNLYQVMRYQIHQAEHPESNGVDSREPMQFTASEPLPEASWRVRDDSERQK